MAYAAVSGAKRPAMAESEAAERVHPSNGRAIVMLELRKALMGKWPTDELTERLTPLARKQRMEEDNTPADQTEAKYAGTGAAASGLGLAGRVVSIGGPRIEESYGGASEFHAGSAVMGGVPSRGLVTM